MMRLNQLIHRGLIYKAMLSKSLETLSVTELESTLLSSSMLVALLLGISRAITSLRSLDSSVSFLRDRYFNLQKTRLVSATAYKTFRLRHLFVEPTERQKSRGANRIVHHLRLFRSFAPPLLYSMADLTHIQVNKSVLSDPNCIAIA
ncbi:hypothetical protein NSTC745_06409 [Nostoc sp. DSM 114161]|jgi:hypothetical protein